MKISDPAIRKIILQAHLITAIAGLIIGYAISGLIRLLPMIGYLLIKL